MGLLRVLQKLFEGWFTALVLTQVLTRVLTLVLTQGQAERHWPLLRTVCEVEVSKQYISVGSVLRADSRADTRP